MKRQVKRWMAGILCVALLCAVCGCTPNESGGDDTTTSSSTTTSASSTQASDPATGTTTETSGTSTTMSEETTVTTTAVTTVSTVSTTTNGTSTGKPTASTTTQSGTSTGKPTASTATQSGTSTGKPTASSASATTKSTTKSTTASTTKSTTKSTTRTTKPTNAWDKKTSDIGFGFYNVREGTLEDKNSQWSSLVCSDYVNTVFVWNAEELKDLRDYNVNAWMYVNDVFTKLRNGDETWKETFDALWQSVKESGYAESLLGWYLDEPTDMAAVKTITKYAKEKYGKRFLICFMVNTVAPNVYGGYQGENYHLTKDTSQYLTDIAVDMYWQVKGNENTYTRLYDALHKVMADDAKVWYIPYSYSSYDIVNKNSAEIWAAGEMSRQHIRYMYEWLQKEPPKNRGGLLVFAYNFDSPYERILSLYNINQQTNGKWNFVMEECISIGKEICRGEWDV